MELELLLQDFRVKKIGQYHIQELSVLWVSYSASVVGFRD